MVVSRDHCHISHRCGEKNKKAAQTKILFYFLFFFITRSTYDFNFALLFFM